MAGARRRPSLSAWFGEPATLALPDLAAALAPPRGPNPGPSRARLLWPAAGRAAAWRRAAAIGVRRLRRGARGHKSVNGDGELASQALFVGRPASVRSEARNPRASAALLPVRHPP